MTKLNWDALPREYQTGIDRGVLYFNDVASPWVGLTDVEDAALVSAGKPLYLDGIVYSIQSESSDYQANVEAFTYPTVLGGHILARSDTGVLATQPELADAFNFTYRTMLAVGYRVHLIYNVVATMDQVSHETMTDEGDYSPFSFTFHTTPEPFEAGKPSAHFYADSSKVDISQLEDLLYGTASTVPHFPTVEELIAIFSN